MIDTRFRQLIDSDVGPHEFFRRFVGTFAEVTGSELGLAWNCDTQPFSPICQASANPDALVKLPLSSDKHQEILSEAWQSRSATLVTPPAANNQPMPGILVSPMTRGEQSVLLEFILPVANSIERNREILQTLVNCCRLCGDGPVSQDKAEPGGVSPGSISPNAFDDFVARIHSSLDVHTTADNVANEARRLLDIDRVTVFSTSGRRFKPLSVSGQPTVNHRSNEVSTLSSLANAVLQTGIPLWYPTAADLPPQLEQPLGAHVDISMVRSLAIIPIFHETPEAARPQVDHQGKRRAIGGIVFEQSRNQWNDSQMQASVQQIMRHATVAIRNAEEVRQVPLYRGLKTVGRVTNSALVQHWKRTALIIGGAIAVVLAMCLLPCSFTLGCDGKLVPKQLHRLFASQQGTVRTIHAQHGDTVRKEETLVTIENVDLEIQIEQLSGELNSLEERLAGSRSIRIRQAEPSGENRFNQKELESQIASLRKRLNILGQRRQRLFVKSPIDGQVLTWDVVNILQDRPVGQGDMLLEIANTEGQWELELDLPDRKVSHLLHAQRQAHDALPIQFTLAAEPGRKFTGYVREVATTTSVTADGLQVVRIRGDIEESDIQGLKQAGTAVRARIDCGSRPLGFVVLHEVWEFLQYHLLFRVW